MRDEYKIRTNDNFMWNNRSYFNNNRVIDWRNNNWLKGVMRDELI